MSWDVKRRAAVPQDVESVKAYLYVIAVMSSKEAGEGGSCALFHTTRRSHPDSRERIL